MYVHLSQPGTGNNVSIFSCFFHFDHHSFGLKIIIPFLSPFSFFIVSFIPVFPPCGIFIVPSFAFKNGPRNCQKEFFLEPFSFFRFYGISFWLFSFLCLEHWTLEITKSSFFSNTFYFFLVVFFISFFVVFFRFGNFSFLYLSTCPGELPKRSFSRTLFVFLFFVLEVFPSFTFQIALGNCQNGLFLEPFSFFFIFFPFFSCLGNFSFLYLSNPGELPKRAFSRTLFVFFFFMFFRFCFIFFSFFFLLFFHCFFHSLFGFRVFFSVLFFISFFVFVFFDSLFISFFMFIYFSLMFSCLFLLRAGLGICAYFCSFLMSSLFQSSFFIWYIYLSFMFLILLRFILNAAWKARMMAECKEKMKIITAHEGSMIKKREWHLHMIGEWKKMKMTISHDWRMIWNLKKNNENQNEKMQK